IEVLNTMLGRNLSHPIGLLSFELRKCKLSVPQANKGFESQNALCKSPWLLSELLYLFGAELQTLTRRNSWPTISDIHWLMLESCMLAKTSRSQTLHIKVFEFSFGSIGK